MQQSLTRGLIAYEGPQLSAWLKRIEAQHAVAKAGPRADMDLSERSLARVRQVIDRLGIAFACPVMTVGGTNGKGSTCAMLEAILCAGGFKVGRYSSPHLLRFNERASINGQPVDDEALIASFEAVSRCDVRELTYFEFTTLAILHLFANAQLDAVILEVGLGGRLDAVNAVDADCAVITSVDLDHMAYLGSTREQIGFEKAHIFRPGRVAICCDPNPPASIGQVAARLGAPLWQFGRDIHYQAHGQDHPSLARAMPQWQYIGPGSRRASLPYPALRGANQLLNACAALAALEALSASLPLSQQAVRQGLLTVNLPGRFQILPGQPTVVLDVAHNPHAAACLAQSLDSQGYYPSTHAVVGVLRDKDIEGVLRPLRERVDVWHVAPTQGARGLEAAQLAQAVQAQAPRSTAVHVYASGQEAFEGAQRTLATDDRMIVFGSFALVGEVMRTLQSAGMGVH